jgi:DNA polymerase IV
MSKVQRIILHIDFDSFFASVEQQHNPLFRNKPLGVTATNGRNCIIASSREAKKLGIGTGSRVQDALKICPTINLTGADFVKYWEVSKKFIAICRNYSPLVEVFSIDELFMDISLTAHLFGGPYALIAALKRQIHKEIGSYITVSVGVAENKLLAKLASGMKKPNGMFHIEPHMIEQVYKVASLTDICGIGERIKQRLNQMGVFTLLQLRRTPLSALVAEFGNVEGHFLYSVGQGEDVMPVQSFERAPEAKSVGRNYCLPQNEYDKRVVLQNIYELCEEVCIKLRRIERKARMFGVFLRGTEEFGGHILHNNYSYQGQDMFASVLQALYKQKPYVTKPEDLWEGYVRQIGVYASYLYDNAYLPRSLFPTVRNWEKLSHAVDKINERFGDHAIRSGYLLYADKLTTVPNGFMADRYERLQLARADFTEQQ